MSSDSSVLGHARDVTEILVLGIVYVIWLSLGTLASAGSDALASIKSLGENLGHRLWRSTRSAK